MSQSSETVHGTNAFESFHRCPQKRPSQSIDWTEKSLIAFQFFLYTKQKWPPHTITLSHGIAVVGVPKKKWIWAHGSRGKEDKRYQRP